MLISQNISYLHSNKNLLFRNVSFSLNTNDKVALIGNNGSGKSTLLKIIADELEPSSGQLILNIVPYYVPQIFGQYNHFTIAEALQIKDKLNALHEILKGNVTEKNYDLLNDDWTIEDRCIQALAHWGLNEIDLSQRMEALSGGQKTKVFLAGIIIHQPNLILLDEPSNHLDSEGRQILYDFIQYTTSTLLIVSHDRKLLNLLNIVYELSHNGLKIYGGNYDFYFEQKRLENEALYHDVQHKEKTLRKAKEKERETQERQQKADARGKKKQEKAGVARIMMNTLRNNAEKSTAKLKNVHLDKIGGISQELQELRASLPDIDRIKFGLDHSALHKGKILFEGIEINYHYTSKVLWAENLNFKIISGERIAINGTNGSGKTTFIRLLLGYLTSTKGILYRSENQAVYIDQDYSQIANALTVYEQAQKVNEYTLPEHEVKIRLNRFLFANEDWDKVCRMLSGGEKMRLMLCCLTLSKKAPDLIILDEPTNNLDIQNIEILTKAINEYKGTLIVVSHDTSFTEKIGIERTIFL